MGKEQAIVWKLLLCVQKERILPFPTVLNICSIIRPPTYFLDLVQLHHCVFKVSLDTFERLRRILSHPSESLFRGNFVGLQ